MRPVLLALLLWLGSLPVLAQLVEKVPAAFPKVTVVGSATPDRPYAIVALKVDGREYKDLQQATAAALKLYGWGKAAAKKREKLALDWCTQVLLPTEAYDKAPPEFAARQKPFHPPQARTLPNGTVEVQAWTWRPGSQRGPSEGFLLYTWSLKPDGHLLPLAEPLFWKP